MVSWAEGQMNADVRGRLKREIDAALRRRIRLGNDTHLPSCRRLPVMVQRRQNGHPYMCQCGSCSNSGGQ